jgi:hypothetical protein
MEIPITLAINCSPIFYQIYLLPLGSLIPTVPSGLVFPNWIGIFSNWDTTGLFFTRSFFHDYPFIYNCNNWICFPNGLVFPNG